MGGVIGCLMKFRIKSGRHVGIFVLIFKHRSEIDSLDLDDEPITPPTHNPGFDNFRSILVKRALIVCTSGMLSLTDTTYPYSIHPPPFDVRVPHKNAIRNSVTTGEFVCLWGV